MKKSTKRNSFKVYISGKITGLELSDAESKFELAEKDAKYHFSKITESKIKSINPMKLNHKENATWEDFMIVDIAELFKCNAIYMLDNWRESKGARIEHSIAKEMGIPVFYEVTNFF
jgi:hypothetical protein